MLFPNSPQTTFSNLQRNYMKNRLDTITVLSNFFPNKVLVHVLICFLLITFFGLKFSQWMSQINCRNNVSGYICVLILLSVTTRDLLFTSQIGQLVTNKQNIWVRSALCRNLQFKGVQITLSYFKLTNEWKVRYKNKLQLLFSSEVLLQQKTSVKCGGGKKQLNSVEEALIDVLYR